MTRIHLYEGQRSFLKKSPAPTVEADEAISLAECGLPMRPILNQILSALAATEIRRLHVILQKYVYMATKRASASLDCKQGHNILEVNVLCKHCTTHFLKQPLN